MSASDDGRVEGRVTLICDTTHILIFHPDDLEHAFKRVLLWHEQPDLFQVESEAGHLVAWRTWRDDMYDVRLTNAGLTDEERLYAGPSWAFPLTVRHGRVFVDSDECIPSVSQFEDPNDHPDNWIAVPNGDYRVTVTGVQWSLQPGVAEDGRGGLPDYVVEFALTNAPVEIARRPPTIQPFRDGRAYDTPLYQN